MTGRQSSRWAAIGTLETFGYGLVWLQFQPLRIIASMNDMDGAPVPMQNGTLTLSTPNTRIYDPTQGETTEVSQIKGGNGSLFTDNRHLFKVGAPWTPDWGQGLWHNVNYLPVRTRNASAMFAVTPALEAASPIALCAIPPETLPVSMPSTQ